MENLNQVVAALQQQGVIAYPTEAVFGVGCDPDSETAVNRLLALKQRPVEKGLILIAANYEQLAPYVDDSGLSEEQRARIFASWPGPVTWVMPTKPGVPRFLTGQFDTIAVRVTDHPLVQQLCLAFGKPLTSTSANLTGQEPGRTVADVEAQLGSQLSAILEGETGGRDNPSEIRDAITGNVFRQG
ncbi:L-threonylcarbamoyladenylate synthase type 1 TsaC [Photobacterium gaetbulicola]|uniref:Threonylcarbamoyl-AMP synthase n=1 Tax=Photobacterium gaetbulicola Gung47 TaxID=658445 RepID=A0A0C5WL37_9GAMM|nr:L-threonylcarbamoyladenylate synthase type 1 TsaC [Photobacterium gaetbulicola]AJR07012.1 putative Sua5/YciO/YrdC family protein [Photobacterium gaetbulicola Gung47]PSU03730.1 L-threonylcarbamoyladenylate synthase type 1 TsaC [Photobacterium gaetbulicola]